MTTNNGNPSNVVGRNITKIFATGLKYAKNREEYFPLMLFSPRDGPVGASGRGLTSIIDLHTSFYHAVGFFYHHHHRDTPDHRQLQLSFKECTFNPTTPSPGILVKYGSGAERKPLPLGSPLAL
jgi:hypothetical protein